MANESDSPELLAGGLPRAELKPVEAGQSVDPTPGFRVVCEFSALPAEAVGLALAVDPQGRILVLHQQGDALHLSGFTSGGEPDGVPLTIRDAGGEEFRNPTAVASDSQGRLFVLDTDAGTVSTLSPDGRWLDTTHSAGRTGGRFDHPRDVCSGPKGRLCVTDTFNNRVVLLLPEGEPDWVLESFPNPITGEDEDELFEPASACLDAHGGLWIADTNQNRVLQFDAQRQLASCLDEDGLFDFPQVVRTPGNGTSLFVVDCQQQRLQRFSTDGQRTGVADLRRTGGRYAASGWDIDQDGRAVLLNSENGTVAVVELKS